MQIKLVSKAFVALVGLALIGVPLTTRAQDSTDTSTTTTAPAAKDKPAKDKFNGKIEAISSTSITVKSKDGSLVMAITPKTKFGNKKSPATPADFAVGDKAHGTYSVDGSGTKTADSICKPAPKTASTETPVTPTTPTTPAAQ
jgi:hypothetical protein